MQSTSAMSSKTYIRDKRSPVPKHAGVSKVMSANKAKNTKPEIALRRALWSNGIRGYRLNWKNVPGRPDIAFPGRKLAIFIHGCYWHRCPTCAYPLPKHNTDFWKNKFEKNVTRDEIKKQELIKLGWKVITVWECEIKQKLDNIILNISNQLDRS
jgi:DNA mismatch endonuclease (patch repair protein)